MRPAGGPSAGGYPLTGGALESTVTVHESQPPTRPLTIAHRAGNKLSRLEEAFEAGVDYAEADVWLHHGRLDVRHDKTAGLPPVLWDRWSLRPGWTPRLVFDDLLTAASGRGRLLVDLKGQEDGLGEAVTVAWFS